MAPPASSDGDAASLLHAGAAPHRRRGGEEIELDGALESISGSSWMVAGRQVLIGSDTEIEGHPDVGDRIRVRGVLQAGGVILAERIRVEEEDETQQAEETEAAPPSTTQTPDDDEDQEGERLESTGDVESISAGIWLIGGQTVDRDARDRCRRRPRSWG